MANKPLGIWKYHKLPKNKGFVDNYSEADRVCTVYETLGDKRPITHLLMGVRGLVLMLIYFGMDYDKLSGV